MQPPIIIYKGTYRTIACLVLADGSSPAKAFLDSLGERDRRKVTVLFELLADTGRIPSKERFKKLEGSDDIWAFKSFQVRIPCFFSHGGWVILAFGLWKKTDRWKPADIHRAEEMRRWFLEKEEK